jgi:hypothetical protein
VPLFPKAISALNIVQGDIGDCGLMATIAYIAGNRPDLLPKIIKDNGNGTYTLTRYPLGPNWQFSKTPLTITSDATGLNYASAASELWVAIVAVTITLDTRTDFTAIYI